MQIWGSRTSPYVRKVRVFAIERGVSFDFVEEDPWKKREQLLRLNPLGKVPVMVLDDGRVFFDSLAIVQVLDEIGPPAGRMLPSSGTALWNAMKWHALSQGIIDAVVNRLLETRRPAEFQMEDHMKREEARFEAALAHVDAHIDEVSGGNPDRPGFNALMLGVAMRYTDFRYPHPWRASHPDLSALVGRLAARASFVQTDPPV